MATATAAETKTIAHWIGGRAVERPSENIGDVWNPATGAVIAHVPFASVAVVDEAVAAAKAAFPEWRSDAVGASCGDSFQGARIAR